jgi:hypothetical protein
MFAASRMRGPGTSLMIYSFLIQSQLATCHNSSWCGRSAGAGVNILGSGGQPSAQIGGKCLTKPVTKWTIRVGTAPVPSGIKLIPAIHRQPAWQRIHAPASVYPDTVVIISRQRLSHQAAGSTSQATSRLLDHWIGIRSSTTMRMMRTGWIPERWVVERAVLGIKITMTTARVRRTRRAVGKGPGKTRKQKIGRGKGRGRGTETVKGKVLLNYMRQTQTQRANYSRHIKSRKRHPSYQFPQMMIPSLLSWTANMTQNLILMWICTWKMMSRHQTPLI